MKQAMQVLTSSETNEWYTPPKIIAAVREVLGSIDLDPASHPLPQKWIHAGRYFTAVDDGLSHEWIANTLFMNPPYGKTGVKSNQDTWMQYLISQLPTIDACIALTKTVPGYVWWDDLFNYDWPGPMCITEGRLSFVAPDEYTYGKSKMATSFWYSGPNWNVFRTVFSEIGRVIYPEGD